LGILGEKEMAMGSWTGKACGILILICTMGIYAQAEISLPNILSDNMVLQRERAVPVWGTATAGEEVKVTFRDQSVSTVAKANGKWRVDVPTGKAGGPFELILEGKNKIVIKNILVGEVWVCSGQSNMQFQLQTANNAAQAIPQANYPKIRLFTVPCVASETPQANCNSSWVACTPETAKDFTAVGYFFGLELYKHLNVPVGLINTSWGGTNAETWTAKETLMSTPGLERIKGILEMDEGGRIFDKFKQQFAEWRAATHRTDPGNTGFVKGWAKPDLSMEGWSEMTLPKYFDDIKADNSFDGVVWLRKTVEVPAGWAGKDLVLEIGPVDDTDVTYFNGEKVGQMGYDTNTWWEAPRTYTVPGKLVKAGTNVIAVRVFDDSLAGGIWGKPEQMKLSLAGETQSIPLAGVWKYKVEAELSPIHPELGKPSIPPMPGVVNYPCTLYNAMIHPLLPFGIQGAIWYQGESNAELAYEYRTLFPAMIQCWRESWGQGNFPFLFVQLANFMAVVPQPSESNWAALREAQTMTLGASPNTGMAVIIDIGEANDIHPRNKLDVGKRLALAARAKAYGENIEYSGPIFDSMKIDGNKATIRFQHTGGGLEAKGGEPLKGFAVAGENKKFVWAKAKIEGDTVVVWSDEIAKPVAVRYAWADNPVCNLINKFGLPASPFRTDVVPTGK
jgi:sialate O-acetylesterase